jgi:hypothetical protein
LGLAPRRDAGLLMTCVLFQLMQCLLKRVKKVS